MKHSLKQCTLRVVHPPTSLSLFGDTAVRLRSRMFQNTVVWGNCLTVTHTPAPTHHDLVRVLLAKPGSSSIGMIFDNISVNKRNTCCLQDKPSI
ncbi:Receptor-type adenylate cyclase GRESAG 4 [Echinococcus multilocularis]|uniref:Receptor-type adenylate cyclase GRESAG 4 n=1 Tax=Echinococcus multilocularis TaxID=6211 RepID=A0A0S4MLI7_ECHMU|nr:Receptor-type adenylate cyclase GRESAG 4 [Echinococcus multilocularis]